jgi:hypothetical protein
MHARRSLGAALAALALLSVTIPAAAHRAPPAAGPASALPDDRFPVQLALMSASDVVRAKRCAPPFGCRRERPARSSTIVPFSDLAARAAAYLGRNPTGWARVWCGKFLRMIVPSDPGPAFNAARAWRHYGRASAPQPGAIGVMPHHVGIVLGRCADGRIHLRSGNHNRRVGDGCYAAGRFIAFRSV